MGTEYPGQPYYGQYYPDYQAELQAGLGDTPNIWPLTREELLAIMGMMQSGEM